MFSPPDIRELLDPPTHSRMIFRAHNRGRGLRQSEIDRFRAHGVSAIQLGTPWQVLADRVVFEEKTFRFADDLGEAGEGAFTLIVQGNTGLTDIVAWKPAENRMALWTGDGFALGESHIETLHTATIGLRIFRSPMDWLRANRRGIVILRDDFAECILQKVALLIPDDREHQRALSNIFYENSPKIVVHEIALACGAEVPA